AKTVAPAPAQPPAAPQAQPRAAQAASREPAAPLHALAAQATASPAAHPHHVELPATQEEAPRLAAAEAAAAPAAEPLAALTLPTPRQAAAADMAPAAPALQVSTPVGATQWGQELSRQVVTFSQNLAQGSHTAELRLDPPDLGPLRVTLSLNDGVASASFVSAHAAVRQAVESALPQLQQALSQAGISLGQAHVGDQGQQAMGGQPNGQSSGNAAGGQRQDGGYAQGSPERETAPAPRAQAHDGLVNTYA
ncbi:flagellar hook-length control protein FliK, partial [Bordetella hinzii]|nr:flagellar hook-length control protein FliK [Bordetella hinzii]